MASRTLCKGAMSFGLVHIPAAPHTAATEQGMDFDWPGKRSMERINKPTGGEIGQDSIVKGVAYEAATQGPAQAATTARLSPDPRPP